MEGDSKLKRSGVMKESDVSVGDWIGCYDMIYNHRKQPHQTAKLIVSKGARIWIEQRYRHGSPSRKAVAPEDIIRIFDSQAQGDRIMAAAHEQYRNDRDIAKKLETVNRNKLYKEICEAK